MDGTVVVAESFAFSSDNRTPMIIGREYKTKRPLYDFPTSSAFFEIRRVSGLSSSLGAWKIQDIKTKCFSFPSGQPGEFATFPLIHTTVM
ncbi:hypothetical protein HPB48_019316 [Haemaphysalis longicornis]|uniref:Uncharacterized protein n=1 Tax=Haemaphysalis longicornis TaxID=44386 RepID=A0A9J6FEE8_HAELO|nr:hypothetical protein HPB48_019316 [Haemaphysalis longicornis]